MSNECTRIIQSSISDLYSVGRYTAPTGALELAFSRENGNPIQTNMIQQNGIKSKYSITYVSPSCDSPVDGEEVSCSVEDEASLTSCITFDTFYNKSMPNPKRLQINSLRDIGNASQLQVLSNHIWDNMQKIKEAIDLELVVFLCANASTCNTEKIKLINSLGAPNFSVDGNLIADMADYGFAGITPLLIGNRQVYQFAKLQQASGMSNAGVDLGMMSRFPAFYDKNFVSANCAPDTSGNDVMLSILPGIVNVVNWSANSGLFATRETMDYREVDPSSLFQSGDTYLYTTIADPKTGMLFDLDLVFNTDCKAKGWTYRLSANYRFVMLPVTGCANPCFNGVLKYDICPSETVTC